MCLFEYINAWKKERKKRPTDPLVMMKKVSPRVPSLTMYSPAMKNSTSKLSASLKWFDADSPFII